jgi:hypothetical protein
MTSTGSHETEIIPDPDVPLVRITREFGAAPAKVVRAHTDRDAFLSSGMAVGVREGYERLDAVLGRLTGPASAQPRVVT